MEECAFLKCMIPGCNKLASSGARGYRQTWSGWDPVFSGKYRVLVVYCDIGFCPLAKQKKEGQGKRLNQTIQKVKAEKEKQLNMCVWVFASFERMSQAICTARTG